MPGIRVVTMVSQSDYDIEQDTFIIKSQAEQLAIRVHGSPQPAFETVTQANRRRRRNFLNEERRKRQHVIDTTLLRFGKTVNSQDLLATLHRESPIVRYLLTSDLTFTSPDISKSKKHQFSNSELQQAAELSLSRLKNRILTDAISGNVYLKECLANLNMLEREYIFNHAHSLQRFLSPLHSSRRPTPNELDAIFQDLIRNLNIVNNIKESLLHSFKMHDDLVELYLERGMEWAFKFFNSSDECTKYSYAGDLFCRELKRG
jgi:hypothetical protein